MVIVDFVFRPFIVGELYARCPQEASCARAKEFCVSSIESETYRPLARAITNCTSTQARYAFADIEDSKSRARVRLERASVPCARFHRISENIRIDEKSVPVLIRSI